MIEYIQTPTSLDGLEITKGQLVDYKYYTGNKYSYCKLKLKMSNNSFNDIKSSRCSHTMHDSRSLGVTIWSKPDLTRFGETAIYQMIRDDGFEIIKFDNKMILASKKGYFTPA